MILPDEGKTGPELGSPVACGERVFVPLLRRVRLTSEGGGFLICTAVALLVGEAGTWSFVSLEDGIGQDILEGLKVPSRPDG